MTDHAPTSSTARALRPDIQGLRALAVVAVILDHAIGWPLGGFVGVDVFFVISGFLITGLLLRDLERTGRVSFRDFYAKRMRRILPAALVVLAVTAGVGFVVFNVTRAWQTVWDAVYSLVFVANWRFAAQGTDYFHASDAVSPLQHFWSLSVEEQFYLVWPGLVMLLLLLLPAALRRGAPASASASGAGSASARASVSASRMRAVRIVVGVAAAIVVAASFGWAVVQTGSDPTVAYFSTLTRAWELALGAVLAAALPLLLRLPSVLRAVLGWVGLAGIVASFFVIDGGSTPFPGPGAALPVVATAVLIAGGVGGGRQRHLFPLTNPVSVFVGDMSYSLYLWHFPVIVFFAVLLPTPGPTTTGIVLATIGALALVSYFLVEQPLHRSPLLRSFRVAAPGDPEQSPPPDARDGASSGAGGGAGRTGTRYGSGSAAARTGTRYGSAASPAVSARPAGRGSTGASAPAVPSTSAGSDEGAAPNTGTRYGGGAATTRPAGWTPGSLYSPASAQRLRPGNPRAAARPTAARPAGEGPAGSAAAAGATSAGAAPSAGSAAAGAAAAAAGASPAGAPPRPHTDPAARASEAAPRAGDAGRPPSSASDATTALARESATASATSGATAASTTDVTTASASAAATTPPTPPARVRTPAEARAARRAAWGAWRERFGTQFLLSGSGLVVVVVLLALVLQFTVRGGAPLAQFDFGGGGADTPSDSSQVADPTPILQGALQEALGATEWPNLTPSLDQVMSRTSSDNPARACFDPGSTPDFGRCTWGSGSAPNHMYLVGDSTAMAYAPAFKKLAEQSGGQWRITTIGMYGCRFTDVLVKNDGAGVMDSCPQRKADVAARISADAPQLVVVSNAYALGNAASGSPLSASALIASTAKEMSKYNVPGRIVYLAPPPLGADLGTCYSPVTGPSACAVAVDGAWHDFENAAESTAAASGDHAISSLPFSCWNEMCPAFAGTLPMKYDETHLTVAFSESLSAILRYDFASLGLM
ncbi:acyltransferase family protein [Cnuibacter sp. UC19_7]|uniref:acyltransferase family protein n=1 Tax=Cnuibacter sp. UC19_7 TaxID=3350166 RepID=UPI00366F93A9